MFPAFLMPMLIGAGTGALGGLLTGKDPLKGALFGGATGGLLSSIPALGAAGAGTGGAKVAMGDIASSTGLPAALKGSSLAPELLSGAAPAVGGANVNLARFAADAPMSFSYAPEVLGGANIGNLSQYATGAGTDLMAKTPSMFDQISPYLNVRDLSGAAQVASQFQPRPLPTPQQGQVTQGRAPQGTDVMALLQSIKQPERRRITLL